MSIDEIVKAASEGNPVKTNGKSFGVCAKDSLGTNGVIEFYFNGELSEYRAITDGVSRTKRNRMMNEMVKKAKNLKGDRYFIWKPEN